MEHTLHLVVGHVLSRITPMHTERTRKARIDDEDDNTSDDAAASNDGSAIISHGLHKLLGLIKQVRVVLCICLHPLIHLSDTKITSSSCLLQAYVPGGRCPGARARAVCTNSMGIDVCVSG